MSFARLTLALFAVGLASLILIGARIENGQAQSLPGFKPDQPSSNDPIAQLEFRQPRQLTEAEVKLLKLHESEASCDRDVADLLAQYARDQDEAKRGAVKTKLAAALDKQFELQQQRREIEAAQIEAQIKKLRELMKKRSDARQTIVQKRLDQLVNEADGLGWTSPHGASGRGDVFYPGGHVLRPFTVEPAALPPAPARP